jgi:TonB family protein
MKKSNMFWGMLGLSTVLHGLVLIEAGGTGFSPPPPVPENQAVSALKIIKVVAAPQRDAPGNPQEQKTIEKAIEPVTEPPATEAPEADHREEAYENEETQDSGNSTGSDAESMEDGGSAGNNGEMREGEAEGSGEAMTNREYEVLLAYIKDFISENLVYPPMARRRNVQGVVGVYFEIDENGEPVSVAVHNSSGSSILDNAAVSLIQKIRALKHLAIKRKLSLNVNIDYKLTE